MRTILKEDKKGRKEEKEGREGGRKELEIGDGGHGEDKK